MSNMFDHRALQRQVAVTEHLEPFRVTSDGYLTGGPDGDERLILRAVLNSEAAKRDARGITPQEGVALVERICQMPDIEHIALRLQQQNAILRREMQALMDHLKTKTMPPDRAIAKAAQTLRDTA